MARQNASVDNLRDDQISFRANKLNVAPRATEVINRLPNLNQVQFPQEAFQQPDRESMTANFISNLLPKAGDVVGDVVSRGKEIAGTGLEKLTELAKDPRTYEVLSNVLAVGSAPYSPQLSQTYGNIASGIRESRIAKQEAETAKTKLALEEIKEFEKERKANINNLITDIPKDEDMKRARQALFSANAIKNLIRSDTQLTPQALKTQIPRLMGEVGNLTQQEQAAWTGDPRIVAKVNRFIETNIFTGKLREEDKKLFIELIDTLENAHKQKINQTLEGYVKSNVLANPDYYTEEELISILQPRVLSPEKPTKSQPTNKPQQTVTKQKKQTVTDKEAVSMFGES